MDRRTIWAILLMMAIAVIPAIFLKKSAAGRDRGTARTPNSSGGGAAPSTSPVKPLDAAARDTASRQAPVPGSRAAAAATGKIVRVTSPLYTYGISTRGARLV